MRRAAGVVLRQAVIRRSALNLRRWKVASPRREWPSAGTSFASDRRRRRVLLAPSPSLSFSDSASLDHRKSTRARPRVHRCPLGAPKFRTKILDGVPTFDDALAALNEIEVYRGAVSAR